MRSYKVEVWFSGQKTDLVLTAANSAHAMTLAKKVYPNSRVVAAREVK